MQNYFRLMLLPLLCPLLLWSRHPGNDNIIISSASETYRFSYSKQNKSVEIKQEDEYNYSCVNFRDNATFYEFFDDQEVLNEVEFYENGKKSYAEQETKAYNIEGIFYSDTRLYELNMHFPKSGWENKVRMKKTIKDPRYFCTVYFMNDYRIKEKQVTIILPRWMKTEIKEFYLDRYHIEKTSVYSEKEDADIITYTVRDLPGKKDEANEPGPSFYLPHLLVMSRKATVNEEQFTFFNTLQDQYNWYRKMTGLMKNDKNFIATKAKEITANVQDDMDKIKKVLYWVHDNIRYIAFEDGIAGFKPDEAQNVLNKRYGDCKGMANLTKELLVALGFDAHLAWIGTNHIAYDYSTPALCVDNHMICCLLYKGKKYFLDGTESYLPLGVYAERIQGRQVLVENGDQFILEKIPSATSDQNLTLFREKLIIDGDKLSGNIEYVYKGESREQLLHAIHSTRNEKINEQLERYISNDNKNYIVSNIENTDPGQVEGDFSIRFKLDYKGAVSSFGNEMYIDIDYNKIFDQFIIDTAKRNSDYRFGYKYNYQSEVDLQIPAGYKIHTLPADYTYSGDGFSFSIHYTSEGNTVKYRKQLKIQNTLLEKRSFSSWNKAVKGLTEKYLEQVVLAKQ